VPAGGRELDVPELRRDLTDVLPLAMIPSRFIGVAELPTTRTGKIDRAALVSLADDGPRPDHFVAPSGDIECWLVDQVSGLLDVERVSADDDLFALGGDSITATRLASRVWRELDVSLSPRDIFGAATVTGIATSILEQQLQAADPDELRALLDAVDDPHEGTVPQLR
jgi:acyl carrier protein